MTLVISTLYHISAKIPRALQSYNVNGEDCCLLRVCAWFGSRGKQGRENLSLASSLVVLGKKRAKLPMPEE